MAVLPVGGALLLRSLKVELIDVLSADPDYALQHADALSLLSLPEYRRLKALVDPSEKTRDLLDCVIQKGHGPAEVFLEFLKKADTLETFPKLAPLTKRAGDGQPPQEQSKTKRKNEEAAAISPKKTRHEAGSGVVTEKQLMLVARGVGRSWKQVARLALEIPTVNLEQIEEENPANHVERVFAMLRLWRMRERGKATAARLHSLLSREESGLPPESIDFLLDPI
ncbi:hypothetical protein MATL_G00103080 [Megalops atlanticus]|uniref:Uncharacterized protein n=1 Tax=Megalops atlanticus TaxID=7932 RepID=A0A9D3T5B5_MEGAT|nr:hypothetical protein MATL_G00103080 [Megalops atlanticus]